MEYSRFPIGGAGGLIERKELKMDGEFVTTLVVVLMTVVRLGVPVVGIWLVTKALRFSLTVLP